jgi:type I restriction enzyme, S subunit
MSGYKPYPKYKDSGVEWLGQVPEHWDVKRIRFMSRMNPTKQEISDLPKDTVCDFFPMDAVGEDGSLNAENQRQISEVEAGFTYFAEGDVTYAKITPCFENGKGAVMQGLSKGFGFGTTELTVIRPNAGVTDSKYLWYLTKSSSFRKLGESWMYGAGGQKRVPDDFCRNLPWAWASITEQKAIAKFLDRETLRIDTLIQEQRELIALLKEKRQAVISNAVTKGLNPKVKMKDSGVEWIGEIPAHWVVSRIRFMTRMNPSKQEVAHISRDAMCDFLPMESVGEDGILRLENQRLLGEVETGYTFFAEGDVTYAKITPCFENGKGAVMQGLSEGFGFGTTELTVIRPNAGQTDSKYLWYVTKSSVFRKLGESWMYGAGGQKRVPDDFCRNLRLAWPSISEQRQIAIFLDAETLRIDNLMIEAENTVELMLEHRASLISEAVTGKIDVRGVNV